MAKMGRPKQETLVLFPEVEATTRKLTDEQFGAFMRAAFGYRFRGEVYAGDDAVVDMAFQFIASQIDRYKTTCETNSKNRTKSNESQGNPTKSNETPSYSYSYSNHTHTHNEGEAAEPPAPEKDKPKKHKFGEYNNVLLSDVELDKLKQQFPTDWLDRINRLSGYVESKGAKYKSHYATILNWARRDKEKAGEQPDYTAGSEDFL